MGGYFESVMGKEMTPGMGMRRRERWKKKYESHKAMHRAIRATASDILQSSNFRSTKQHIQHGNVTVNTHCMNVARSSLAISERLEALGVKCNRRDLIRGALLHDYFLYDWHDENHRQPYKLHGFYHPGLALANASKEYELTERQREIIRKHMWPLTVIPPTCREAWIVTVADKWVSILETVHIYRGHGRTSAEQSGEAGR